jgi:hypothetical protein
MDAVAKVEEVSLNKWEVAGPVHTPGPLDCSFAACVGESVRSITSVCASSCAEEARGACADICELVATVADAGT